MTGELNKIIRGCQQADPGAQRALYDIFRSKMFGICLRYSGNYDDANDVFQEGFIKVYEKIGQFSFKGAFEGWMRKIMVNTAFEKYRKQLILTPVDENLPEDTEEEMTEGQFEIDQQELLKYIQELSPKYRLVFNLYAIEGFSHKEISEILNISEGTSKSNLSRARRILKEKVHRHYLKSVQSQ